MKRIISAALCALILASSLTACAAPQDRLDPAITLASSDAYSAATWLDSRLGEIPDDVVIGIGSDNSYGVDLSNFEDDGYIVREMGGEVLIFGASEDGLDRASRAYAKAVEKGENAGMNIVYHEGNRVERLTVGGRDISEYAIKLAGNVNESLEFAAENLAQYLAKTCGYTPDVSEKDSAHMIILEQITAEDDRFEALGDDGFTIEVKENGDICITGGRYRGCIYGVFEFLESYIGWSFVFDQSFQNVEYLPEADHIDIPVGTSETQTPSFPLRMAIRKKTESNPSIATSRSNYLVWGEVNHVGVQRVACHGLWNFDFFDELVFYSEGAQPCYTLQDNIDFAIEGVLKKSEEHIAAGKVPGVDFVTLDVSQPDSDEFCTCKSCREMYNDERGHAGAVLQFTNAIADAIAEEISPDIYVAMLAYWGTTTPPKTIRPRENVSISYCYYTDINKNFCAAHCLDGEECSHYIKNGTNGNPIGNDLYTKELKKWCEITTLVNVWYYPGLRNFNEISTSILFNVRDDVRFLHSIGVHGVYTDPAWFRVEDKAMLYMLSKLLWNVDTTEEECIEAVKEYYRVICGDGYEELYEFEEFLQRIAKDPCYSSGTWSDPEERIYFAEIRDNADYIVDIFDEAVAQTCSAEQELLVEEMQARMYYTVLLTTHTDWYVEGNNKAGYEKLFGDFKSLVDKNGFYMESVGKNITSDQLDIEENVALLLGKLFGTEEDWYLNW